MKFQERISQQSGHTHDGRSHRTNHNLLRLRAIDYEAANENIVACADITARGDVLLLRRCFEYCCFRSKLDIKLLNLEIQCPGLSRIRRSPTEVQGQHCGPCSGGLDGKSDVRHTDCSLIFVQSGVDRPGLGKRKSHTAYCGSTRD